jgi:bacterioferritin (cytochrome b1)
MMTTIDQLNEILGHVLACAATLRRAEQMADDPSRRVAIRQLYEKCDVNAVNVAGAVSACGGLPTLVPSARLTIRLKGESSEDALDLAFSAYSHVVAELDSLIDEVGSRSWRELLQGVRQSNVVGKESLLALLAIKSGD